MLQKNWSQLSTLQLGRFGEYYAMMEFMAYGFDVYSSEVDEHGVDFVAKNKYGVFYEVQVKSLRDYGYIFIRKDNIILDDRHLICFVRFVDREEPEIFVIPSTVYIEQAGSAFTSHDYVGMASKPEFGINVSKTNMDILHMFDGDQVLAELVTIR